MTWGRLDDRLDDNPKFCDLPLEAVGLWTMCRPKTLRTGDGFVPSGLPRRFAGAKAARLAAILIERGLWEVVEGGWRYHDYGKYELPPALRAKRSQAGTKGANRRWHPDGSAMASAIASNGNWSPEPEPVPVPVPSSVGKPTSPRASARGEAGKAVQELTETWNGHCSPLPRVTVQPREGKVRHRLMLECHALVEGDMGRLARAIEAASRDPKYREVPYGIDTFCRHAERWLDATAKPDRDTTTTTEPPWAGYGFGQLPPDQLNGAAPGVAAGMLA